jgi:hypothetical protein
MASDSPPLLPELLHRRVTQLREQVDHQGQPGRYLNPISMPRTGELAQTNIAAEGPSERSSRPDDVASENQTKPGRGRPTFEMDPSNKRAVARAYLGTGITLENLYKGIKEVGGPAREWLRRFLTESLGLEDSKTALSEMRLRDPVAVKQRQEEQRRALNAVPRGDIIAGESELESSDAYRPQKRTRLGNEDVLTKDSSSSTLRDPSEDISQAPTGYLPIANTADAWSDRTAVLATQRVGAAGPLPMEVTSKKRKSPIANFNLSGLADALSRLDRGRNRTIYHYILKRVSLTKDTIASRLSTGSSITCPRTSSSDFYLYYHSPGMVPTTATTSIPNSVQADFSEAESEVGSIFESPAVNILKQGWFENESDETILSRLENALPSREDERPHFVNAADHRGVTPLHLAPAYGLPKTCGFLVDQHANYRAVTTSGESIKKFTRPAQRLAGNDIQLYCRIFNCRTFTTMGKAPPVPQPRDEPNSPPDTQSPTKRMKGKSKGRNPLQSEQQDLHFGTEGPRASTTYTTSISSSADAVNVDPSDAIPQFSSRFFYSPTHMGNDRRPEVPYPGYQHRQLGNPTPQNTAYAATTNALPNHSIFEAIPNHALSAMGGNHGSHNSSADISHQPSNVRKPTRRYPMSGYSGYRRSSVRDFASPLAGYPNPGSMQPTSAEDVHIQHPTSGSAGQLWANEARHEQQTGYSATQPPYNTTYNAIVEPTIHPMPDYLGTSTTGVSSPNAYPTHPPYQPMQSGYLNELFGDSVYPYSGQFDYSQTDPATASAPAAVSRPSSSAAEATIQPTTQGQHQYGFAAELDFSAPPAQPSHYPVYQGQHIERCPGPPQCPGYVFGHGATSPLYNLDYLCDACFSRLMVELNATGALQQ